VLNPAPKGNDQQIAVTAAESAALIGVPEKIELLNFLVDKSETIVLPDVQELLEEDQPKEPKRETSFLGGAMRFAGAIVGFLVGGPAGAALGSIVGEVMGDMAAERSSIVWPDLGRAFFYPKGGYHEEDACDRSSHHSFHLERSRCEGRRTTDL
jgi:hypothetical protein